MAGKYYLYLKSHTEAPDYEDLVKAANIDEAVALFLQRLSQSAEGWTADMIREHVEPIS